MKASIRRIKSLAQLKLQLGHRVLVAAGGSFQCFGTTDSNLLLPGCFTGLSGIGLALLDQVNRDDRLQSVLSTGLLSPSRAVVNA